jgi:hypothetical protein
LGAPKAGKQASGADIVGWGAPGRGGAGAGVGTLINQGAHVQSDGAACQTPEERPRRAVTVEGRFHRFLAKLLTGDEAPEVHKNMDAAWPLGRHHRQVWGHDKRMILYQFARGPKKGIAAVSHIMLDRNKKLQRLVKRLEEARR